MSQAWEGPEKLPSNWRYDVDGYRYRPLENGKFTLNSLFKPAVYVRQTFGGWGVFTGGNNKFTPYMDGCIYPTHLAAIIAAELEIARRDE